jgi:hypothetical protein
MEPFNCKEQTAEQNSSELYRKVSVKSSMSRPNEIETSRKKFQLKTSDILEFFVYFHINPFNKFYYGWLILNSIIYLYNLIFLIARFAFWLLEDSRYSFMWRTLDYFLSDLIFLLDMFVRCTTGFMHNGELCTRKLKITRKYFNSIQSKLDLISVLPTDLLYYTFLYKYSTRFLPAMRLNRLVRFSRFIEYKNITETKTKYPTLFRMNNLLLNILIAMHWNACIYFIVSDIIGFGHDEWVYPALTSEKMLKNLTTSELSNLLLTHRLDVQYVYCFWWSVLTLTTIAEVPKPTNFYQEIYMSVLLIIGVVILAITIGSAGDMVENANMQSLQLQTKCDYAKSFLKQNKITGQLEQRIKNYLDYLWITPDINQDDVFESLPYNLRKEIAMNVHIETLKRVHVFQDCEPGLLEELVTKLKLQIYSPGDYVCRKGDVGHEVNNLI